MHVRVTICCTIFRTIFCTICCFVVVAVALGAKQSLAQEVLPLTGDEQQAMEAINQRVVEGGLFFLASDALEGRGTPSRGFDIACEYVAMRFKAAGLEGLGKDGSYFQEATVNKVQTPSTGLTFSYSAGLPLKHLGLLNGGEEEVSFKGLLETINEKDDLADKQFSGPVIVNEMKGSTRSLGRQVGTLGRLANQIKRRGGTAILLKCSEDSQLIEYAKGLTTPHAENRRTKISLPVLLISAVTAPDSDLSEGGYTLVFPKQIKTKTVVRNTIGILRGSDPELKNEAIIFTAHLDHLGIRDEGEDRIYNGADDNASGCTGVMSLADAFGALKTRPKRSLIFMTFWGEERGLLGSRYYCANPLWPLKKTVANINLEMIGRPEAGATNKAWMTGWDQSDLGRLMAKGSARSEVEIFQHPRFSAMLYRASDNFSFVDRGVIAHSFSAGSLHGDYHQPSDEWELLNTEHMTRVIKGLFAGSLPLANGRFTPKSVTKAAARN